MERRVCSCRKYKKKEFKNVLCYVCPICKGVKPFKEKHEQTYDKAFKECRESTVTAQYVNSKAKEKHLLDERSHENCKYKNLYDNINPLYEGQEPCRSCLSYDKWQPKEAKEKPLTQEEFILKHSRPDIEEKPKKLKLRMTEDLIRDIQHMICFECRDRSKDICKACIYEIKKYVKVGE